MSVVSLSESAPSDDSIGALFERIDDRSARVGIIGLGYVGVPLIAEFSRRFPSIGFDTDPGKCAFFAGNPAVEASGDFAGLSACDAIVICVPTPLEPDGTPDLSYVEAAVRRVAERLRPGQLVVLESTTYPGTTDTLVLPALLRTGLSLDRDFLLAFSPERIDPGNTRFGLSAIPKVVGGCSVTSTRAACALYGAIVERVHPVSSARAAEATKLLENTFRSVNIALANEMSMLCRRLGIPPKEVIDAAATKPFGFMPFYPGPGVGGHCIPLDPLYLAWKARQEGFTSRFIALADEVNAGMPAYTAGLACDALRESGKVPEGARVLLLGVAYKENVADTRESPAVPIARALQARGAEVVYHDPLVERFGTPDPLHRVELTTQELLAADCAIVVTAHRGVDYDRVARLCAAVVDMRYVLSPAQRKRARGIVVPL